MNEDFVSFPLAKKLNEKGFNCEHPFAMYNKYEQFCPLYSSDKDYFGIDDFNKHACIAPTISQVLEWLRDKNAIFVHISIYSKGWYCDVYTYEYYEEDREYGAKHNVQLDEFSTYEEAALAGIEYALDNVI